MLVAFGPSQRLNMHQAAHLPLISCTAQDSSSFLSTSRCASLPFVDVRWTYAYTVTNIQQQRLCQVSPYLLIEKKTRLISHRRQHQQGHCSCPYLIKSGPLWEGVGGGLNFSILENDKVRFIMGLLRNLMESLRSSTVKPKKFLNVL